uniref:Uncharacterized protein n=1 Tax=Helianthus annuus TaxID=4232 RepID=A0A251SZ90_HELAN
MDKGVTGFQEVCSFVLLVACSYVALVLLGTVYAPAATRGPLILVLFKFFYKLMHQLEQQAPKCTCHIILLQFLEFRYLEKGLKTSRY